MAEIDTADFRAFVRGRATCYRTTEIDHDTAVGAVVNMCEHDVPPLLNELDRLQAENQRLADLNRRAQAIIADAIAHGMPITKEVAAVRNGIVCGKESPADG